MEQERTPEIEALAEQHGRLTAVQHAIILAVRRAVTTDIIDMDELAALVLAERRESRALSAMMAGEEPAPTTPCVTDDAISDTIASHDVSQAEQALPT